MAIYVADFEGCFQRLLDRGDIESTDSLFVHILIHPLTFRIPSLNFSTDSFWFICSPRFWVLVISPSFSPFGSGREMTPGLIWVNPRFVHLDKSTNLEEASKKSRSFGDSKRMTISKPPVGERDFILVSISMNQLFQFFSLVTSYFGILKIWSKYYDMVGCHDTTSPWLRTLRPCTTAVFALRMWW